MPTFTPPSRSGIPPILPDVNENPPGWKLRAHYRALKEGINVYMYRVGTRSETEMGRVTETDPSTFYDGDLIATDGWSDLELVFWGGHAAVEVTAEQQAALEDAGYTVDP